LLHEHARLVGAQLLDASAARIEVRDPREDLGTLRDALVVEALAFRGARLS
jgi:hypothetical protein